MARNKAFNEEDILDKALGLFWYKGYNGTSAQDLVDGLGINRSSLYNTFGDKRTLFLNALKKYQRDHTEALVKAAAESRNAPEDILQIFQRLIDEGMNDELTKGCFMVNTAVELAPHDQEIAAIVRRNMEMAEKAFFEIIKRGQLSGQMETDIEPKVLARFLASNVTGLRVAIRSGKGREELNDIVKVIKSLLK